MAPLRIGLTGGIAAGKSEALAALAATGSGDDLQRPRRPRAARRRADAKLRSPTDGVTPSSPTEPWIAPGSARSSSPTPRSSPGSRRRSTPWSVTASPSGWQLAPGGDRGRGDRGTAAVRDRDGGALRRHREHPHLGRGEARQRPASGGTHSSRNARPAISSPRRRRGAPITLSRMTARSRISKRSCPH